MRRRTLFHCNGTNGLKKIASALLLLGLGAGLEARAASAEFNNRGNVLIADRANNRVIEVNPDQQIVWQFGDGGTVPGPTSVVAPCDAERIGGLTFICGSGGPLASNSAAPDNRVLAVNQAGAIVWQYGQAGVSGSGPNELNTPVCAMLLPGNDVLITDQGNQRVIQVDWNGNLVWQYGVTGMPGSGPDMLDNPASAHVLRNGDVLIADQGNNRVLEVSRDIQNPAGFNGIVWRYAQDSRTGCPLKGPAYACRLQNGNTLITDTGNNRVVEVTPADELIWLYCTKLRAGSVQNPAPTRAVRLRNGHTLISDQFNQQVIEITRSKQIVYTYGTVAQPLAAGLGLNAPHDAKAIGDFTGLPTPCP